VTSDSNDYTPVIYRTRLVDEVNPIGGFCNGTYDQSADC